MEQAHRAVPEGPAIADTNQTSSHTASSWHRGELSQISRQLLKQGFAIIQPPQSLSQMLHTVGCSSCLLHNEQAENIFRFSARAADDSRPGSGVSGPPKRQIALRSCAVQSLIASCWIKALGRDPSNCRQYGPSDDFFTICSRLMNGQLDPGVQSDLGFSDPITGASMYARSTVGLDQGEDWIGHSLVGSHFGAQTAGAVRSACALLREHFPWFEEDHLRERPTLQALTDFIIQRETAYHHNAKSCLSGRGVCDALSILEVVSSTRRDIDKVFCVNAALQRGVDQAIAAVITPIIGGGPDGSPAARENTPPRAPPDWNGVAKQLRALLDAASATGGSGNCEGKVGGSGMSISMYESSAAASAAAMSYGGLACKELDTLANMVLSDLGPEYLSLLRDHGGSEGFAGLEANRLSILTLHKPRPKTSDCSHERQGDTGNEISYLGETIHAEKHPEEADHGQKSEAVSNSEKSQGFDNSGISQSAPLLVLDSSTHGCNPANGVSFREGGMQSNDDADTVDTEGKNPFEYVNVDEHCSGLLAIFMSPPFSGHYTNDLIGGSSQCPVIEVPTRSSAVRTSNASSGAIGCSGASGGSFRRAPAGTLVIVAGRMLEAVTSPPVGTSSLSAGAVRRFPLRPRLRIACSGDGKRCSICASTTSKDDDASIAGNVVASKSVSAAEDAPPSAVGGSEEVAGSRDDSSYGDQNTRRVHANEEWRRCFVGGAEGLFVYELHAHPGAVLTPEEYGRMCMGKATPPLFRSSLSVRSVLSTSAGRPSLRRLVRPDLFPGLLATPVRVSRCEDSNAAGASCGGTGSGSTSSASENLEVSISPCALGSAGTRNDMAAIVPSSSQRTLAAAEPGAESGSLGRGLSAPPEPGREEVTKAQPNSCARVSYGQAEGASQRGPSAELGRDDCQAGGGASSCLLIPDVACLLLGYLDLVVLCRAAMVCRAWRMAGASPSLWRRVDLSPLGSVVTDEALATLAGRLRHTRRLILNGCGRVTDVGVEIVLGSDPARRGGGREERDRWARECETHGLPQDAYGMEVVIKNHRFRVYGFGRDSESGRSFVRGRTIEGGEVKVRADHVITALGLPGGQTNPPQAGAAGTAVSARPETALSGTRSPADGGNTGATVGGGAGGGGGAVGADSSSATAFGQAGWQGAALASSERAAVPARFEYVAMNRCRLMTIRSVRLLEAAAVELQGVPGPVTICVEAEGAIAARTVIFFKIRRNQPLKRLLTSYTATAQLVHPTVRVEFRFRGAAVYAHDTALGLGLDDAEDDGIDVPRFFAVLPRLRVRIYLLPPPHSPLLPFPRHLSHTPPPPAWLGMGAFLAPEEGEGRTSPPCAAGFSGRYEPAEGAAAAAAKARWYGGGMGLEEFEFVLRGSERLDALDAQCRARIGLPISLLCLAPAPPPLPTVAQASGHAGPPWGANMGFVTPPVLNVNATLPPTWRMNMQATPAQLGWRDGQRLWGQRTVTLPEQSQRPAGGRLWRQVPAASAWFVPEEWGVAGDAWLLVAEESLVDQGLIDEGAGAGRPARLAVVVFGVFPGVGLGSGCGGSARIASMASAAAAGVAVQGRASAVGSEAGHVTTLLVDVRSVLPAAARSLRVTPTLHLYALASADSAPAAAAGQAATGCGMRGAADGAAAAADIGPRGGSAAPRLVAVVEGADEAALRDAVYSARRSF